MELSEALERATPLRKEIAPDWLDVVRRARPRRRRRTVVAVALGAAVGAAAFAALAFWPGGDGGVLQRALAAIGDGPIVHVVYRSEVHETVVNLATGERTPRYMVDEQWYAAGKGMKTVSRFDGKVVDEGVSAPGRVSPFEAQTAAGALDGYRAALASGDAEIIGTDTVAGRDVYWIAFRPEELPDVADGKRHAFGEQVAIDRSTYQPVYVRYARDGVPTPGTGQEILSVDTLPAGAVDFTPTTKPQRTMVFGRTGVEDVTGRLAAAATELGHAPLWLDRSYDGHALAFAHLETLVNGPAGSPTRSPAVELCYGAVLPAPNGAVPMCDTAQPGVYVEEAPSASAFMGAPVIPAGSAVVDWSGRAVYIQRDGLTIHVTAETEQAALAAARALVQDENVSR